MIKIMVFAVLSFFFGTMASVSGEELPTGIRDKDFAKCLDCHEGIESLDENHAFPCISCHIMPKHRKEFLVSHEAIIRHPASPANAEIFCGKCHEKEIARVNKSLHYTLAGIINQTRYLWGAQKDTNPQYTALRRTGLDGNLKGLPPNPSIIKGPSDLVDDLLRRKCISCHPGEMPAKARGRYRGLGCSACHILYEEDCIYRGDDRVMKGKKGFPKKHTFSNPIPVRQCLHCHNGHRVGADYTGLFEHDYHQAYRTPIKDGLLPGRIYLMDHHQVKPDHHYMQGLLCVDCHGQDDVMGRGLILSSQQQAVGVRCIQCHASMNKETQERSHPGIKEGYYRSRKGRLHRLPAMVESIKAHQIPQMKKVHCLGCHSAWGFMDYGPSLLRDDRKDLSQWAPWRLQGDITIAESFDEQGRFLGHEKGPGPWFIGWRFRRWAYLILGKDEKGRIVPYRPRYQYSISYIDKSGEVILDSVIPERGDGSGSGWAYMPFYPHTVQKRGRSCEACHGQPLAAGQGLWSGQGPDLLMTIPSKSVYPSLQLLSEAEKEKILNKTQAYRDWRFKVLRQDMQEK